MEKTSIFDFISRLAEKAEEKTVQNAPRDDGDDFAAKRPRETESFMRSYNPLSSAFIDKKQITSPRAQAPNKNTIILNNGKNLAGEKKQTATHDMVRLINRHNLLSNKIKRDE